MEILIFNGETVSINSQPLMQYLESLEVKPKLFPPSSACWRGYVGTWELIEDRLFLVDMEACTSYKREYWEVDMNFLFPHHKKVFAEWFTGEIDIPQGEEYSYDYSIAPTYEKNLFLKFENGYITGQRTVDNHERISHIINFHENERIKARLKKMKMERRMKRKLFFIRIFRWLSGKGNVI